MQTKKQKRMTEWGKNLLILLLTFTALSLFRQSTLFEGLGLLTDNKNQEISQLQPDLVGGTKISVEPTRLAVQNAQGRYAEQYKQQTTNQLFVTKLGTLLREALNTANELHPATKAQWQKVISGTESWIYYDFSSNLPLDGLPIWLGSAESNPILSGEARSFLLAVEGENYGLYYYDETAGEYYFCELTEGSTDRFRTAITDFVPNGAIFAFENPEAYSALDDHVMILPAVPSMSVYEVSAPLHQMDPLERDEILRALAFSSSAISIYETADGTVIREGMDTLRILKDGTVAFHSQDKDLARYPVSSDDPRLVVEYVQELLVKLMGNRCGEAQPYLLDIKEEDGSAVISFGYRLNGAAVKIFEEGYAAQFYIQDGAVKDFLIHIRCYTKTDEPALVLPERQATAALKALGGQGHELELAYIDTGKDSHITVNWIFR